MPGSMSLDRSRSEQPSVLLEQVEAVCRNELVTLPINNVLALSVAFVVRHDCNAIEIFAWLAAVLLLNSIHYIATFRRLRPETLPQRLLAVRRANMIDSCLCGVMWAAVPAFMMPATAGQSPLIMLILVGMTAGSTVGFGCCAANNMVFIFPVLATAVLRYGFFAQPDDPMLSFQITLYLAFLIKTSIRVEGDFKRTVQLKIQATSVAASLEIERMSARAAADRMFVLASTDHLTGLANRAVFSARLADWLASPEAAGQGFLFLLDLDHFKSINDTLGHHAGDIVLCEVAGRLRAAVGEHAVVARLGGDEFAIVLPGLAADEAAAQLAEHILGTVAGEVKIDERLVTIGISIGCAKFPDDALTAADLLARADLSLYAAKDAGRQRWRRFDNTLLAAATVARDIEQDLPGAIADGSVQVWYQPQIALADLGLSGLEALIRWNHPVHGWISPPLIVAAAQRTHKSEVLTGFVLGQACERVLEIGRAGFSDISVAVNISPGELSEYDVPRLIRQLVSTHDVDPGRLELELTEEAFAASDEAIAALEALSATGVRLAIADFGTGCSSLAYLRRMPVNRIKIDQAFVTGFADRPQDRILVRAVLGIGQSFGIEVVAEGVESIEEVTILQSFGCDLAQGYYFGQPMRPADLADWMAAYPAKTPPLAGCVATTGIYMPSAVGARTAA